MPGLDYFSKSENGAAPAAAAPAADVNTEAPVEAPRSNVYYNARLDPKNYLEGPLSHNAATRLRQMLARPGIVVSIGLRSQHFFQLKIFMNRLLLASVMESVLELPLRPGSTACTKGK